MLLIDQLQNELDTYIAALKANKLSPSLMQKANDLADKTFEEAEQMGGSILGDVDNRLLTRAKQIKELLA